LIEIKEKVTAKMPEAVCSFAKKTVYPSITGA
jgi:hypothetical protein